MYSSPASASFGILYFHKLVARRRRHRLGFCMCMTFYLAGGTNAGRLPTNIGRFRDHGNDCGALRRAHVGLALSSAEASIVAPFSSGDYMLSHGNLFCSKIR